MNWNFIGKLQKKKIWYIKCRVNELNVVQLRKIEHTLLTGFRKDERERERERKKKKIRVTSAVHNFIDTSYYGSLYYYLVIE